MPSTQFFTKPFFPSLRPRDLPSRHGGIIFPFLFPASKAQFTSPLRNPPKPSHQTYLPFIRIPPPIPLRSAVQAGRRNSTCNYPSTLEHALGRLHFPEFCLCRSSWVVALCLRPPIPPSFLSPSLFLVYQHNQRVEAHKQASVLERVLPPVSFVCFVSTCLFFSSFLLSSFITFLQHGAVGEWWVDFLITSSVSFESLGVAESTHGRAAEECRVSSRVRGVAQGWICRRAC
ncbi:hypothetical protein IWZ03DRAFT_175745 [Phyllosticta citriasiana]|uniref:Transmembrane protein n=1 Tax=Phyllosticta citriasiana TaxID=595635 RepID=A0ABR1KM94_9PEZI